MGMELDDHKLDTIKEWKNLDVQKIYNGMGIMWLLQTVHQNYTEKTQPLYKLFSEYIDTVLHGLSHSMDHVDDIIVASVNEKKH